MTMKEQTPREIVQELDKHIIGQKDAKRAVAIALRNRWRCRQLKKDSLKEEIMPKNILMIGPTGVGKTEISRRLSKLARTPFTKVDATKFTEVGYVGRDVEHIIRDLVEVAIQMVRNRKIATLSKFSKANAEQKLLEKLAGKDATEETIEHLRSLLHKGLLKDKMVEMDVPYTPEVNLPLTDIPGVPGGQMGMLNIGEIMGKTLGKGAKKAREIPVPKALEILEAEEQNQMIDNAEVVSEALKLAAEDGIVFLDEMDKICGRSDKIGGADVSREGVQRDLLPLIEGCTVSTKHGTLKTDHILFISSGAFHVAKPSDLLPELQGRLPIRVKLSSLGKEDFKKILENTEFSLIKQYTALMKTEGVSLKFLPDGIDYLCQLAEDMNTSVEDIGARRLHTIMERVLENISFQAPDDSLKKVKVDKAYVAEQLKDLDTKSDLSKFIL